MPIKEGDRVRIVSREPTDDDGKSGMYFRHYGGMTGTVQKVYSKTEVSVDVEYESLPKEIRTMHTEVRDQMKTKWLDDLSEAGRAALTEREKDFRLRYVVLVAMQDLEKAEPRPKPALKPVDKPAAEHAASVPDPQAPRKTLAEIEAAEQAELLRRAQSK